jgi:DNA-binding LacI/PurR family transcriptional regulator
MHKTMRDIAIAANVSSGTVSRALKNQPGLSEETRQRVMSIAAEFGYNVGRLRREKIRRVTFLVSAQHKDFSKSPFFWDVFQGVEQVCRENDVAPTVLSVQAAADLGKQLKTHAPDAFLVAGFVDPDVLTTLKASGRPVVLVDLYAPGFSCVNPDNAMGGWLAMQHLFDLGRERVAFIGGSLAHYSIAQRAIAYRKAFYETGRMFNPAFEANVPPGVDIELGAAHAMETLLDSVKPDAVFAYNDVAALAAMKVCQARGLRIPEDVAIVGFDDIAIAANSVPPLTTVALDKFDLGYQGAQLMINGAETETASLVPVRLVVRASTAAVGASGVRTSA